MVYATSNSDAGKVNSPLHLHLKQDAIFKKQRASKAPNHLQDKVKKVLDIIVNIKIFPHKIKKNIQKETDS